MKSKKDQILQFIIRYIDAHGYPPTIREIGDGVGLKSPSSVQRYLLMMFVEGTIESDAPEGSPRAIRVPGYRFIKEDKND